MYQVRRVHIGKTAQLDELARESVKGRVFRCPTCHWTYHRDGVGSINIRHKYLGQLPVVGAMAPPTGIRFYPHTCVARWRRREAALLQ